MGTRCGGTTSAVLIGLAMMVVVPGFAAGQAPAVAPGTSTMARTPEGHPDLQGVVWVTGPDQCCTRGTSRPVSLMKRPESSRARICFRRAAS